VLEIPVPELPDTVLRLTVSVAPLLRMPPPLLEKPVAILFRSMHSSTVRVPSSVSMPPPPMPLKDQLVWNKQPLTIEFMLPSRRRIPAPAPHVARLSDRVLLTTINVPVL